MERNSKPDLTALLTALSISSGAMVSAAMPVLAQTTEAKSTASKAQVTEKKTSTSHKKKGKSRDLNGRGCNYPCGCHYGGKSLKGSGKLDKDKAAKTTEAPAGDKAEK